MPGQIGDSEKTMIFFWLFGPRGVKPNPPKKTPPKKAPHFGAFFLENDDIFLWGFVVLIQ